MCTLRSILEVYLILVYIYAATTSKTYNKLVYIYQVRSDTQQNDRCPCFSTCSIPAL